MVIWFVFTDPGFDYRLLPVGAVVPGWVGVGFRHATPLDSLTVSAVVLIAVMLTTRRNSVRRTLLMGAPLGMLLYLTLTGAWRWAAAFFWPLFGVDIRSLPSSIIERGWWNVAFELAGAAMCWWIWTRADLANPSRRAEFLSSGRLHLPQR